MVQKRQVNLNPNQNLRTVFFSADGSVFGLSYGQRIMLWDTVSGRVLGKNINSFDGFALSPDGKILAQGHASGSVILTQIPALTRLAVSNLSLRYRGVHLSRNWRFPSTEHFWPLADSND